MEIHKVRRGEERMPGGSNSRYKSSVVELCDEEEKTERGHVTEQGRRQERKERT